MNISVEGRLDGYTNMSRDVDLLERAEHGEPGARIYEWDGAWVSLGKSQNPERDLIDSDAIRWVMRPTGGKAVLHGHDLTVSLAITIPAIEQRSVKQAYRAVIAPLIEGLRRSGLNALLGEESSFMTRGLKTADCFKHIAPNDVVDPMTGRKLIGCALRLTHRACLAQCSIPIGLPVVDPSTVYSSAHVAIPLDVDLSDLRENIVHSLSSSGKNM